MDEFVRFLVENNLLTVMFVIGAIVFVVAIIGKVKTIIEPSLPMRIVLVVFGAFLMISSVLGYASSTSTPPAPTSQNIETQPTDDELLSPSLTTNTPTAARPTSAPSTNSLSPTSTLASAQSPETLGFGCEPDDYIPELGGSNPPIGTTVCIPSWAFGWISADKARFEILDMYSNDFPVGFTFALFGPVRFVITEVEMRNVRLDVRDGIDTSQLGDFDNKSINLVYQNGKVCAYSDYGSSGCP